MKTDQFLLASNSDPKYTLLNSSFDVINIIRLWEISTKRLVRGRLVALDAAKKNQIANHRPLLQTCSNWTMGQIWLHGKNDPCLRTVIYVQSFDLRSHHRLPYVCQKLVKRIQLKLSPAASQKLFSKVPVVSNFDSSFEGTFRSLVGSSSQNLMHLLNSY